MSTLWHGRGRSRAHPNREYTVDENGTIWRKEKYDARFAQRGKPSIFDHWSKDGGGR